MYKLTAFKSFINIAKSETSITRTGTALTLKQLRKIEILLSQSV